MLLWIDCWWNYWYTIKECCWIRETWQENDWRHSTPLRNSETMRPVVLTPGMLHPRMVCLWSRREKNLWFLHSQPYSSAQVPALIWLDFCSSEMLHWAAKLCWGLFKRLLSDKKVSREESCKASLAQRRMRMTKIRLWSLGDENSTYMCFILPDVLLRV